LQGGEAIHRNAKRVERGNANCSDIATIKVYFSCPKFTVLLVVKGAVIVKAAPVVKAFEGQTIGALTCGLGPNSAGRSWSRR
jgi:hypothetical protein